MDVVGGGNDYRWTNERHLNFLKSVEASFVRTMLENGRLLAMDQRVPESCVSKFDFESRKKRKRYFPTDNLDSSLGVDRRVKRLRLQSSHFCHHDQVVPEMKHVENKDD